MGALKLTNYTTEDLDDSKFGCVVTHPARLNIARGLINEQVYRNVDLVQILNLSKGSVRTHIEQFQKAGIIDIEYRTHFYLIKLKPEFTEVLRDLVEVIERYGLVKLESGVNL